MIEWLVTFLSSAIIQAIANYFLGVKLSDDNKDDASAVAANFRSLNPSKLGITTEDTSRFFFWISPNINWFLLGTILPFALIPFAIVWFYIIYPPGKFYANVPFNRNNTATVFTETIGEFKRRKREGNEKDAIILTKLL